MQILEYLSEDGRSPFAEWFADLDAQAAAKVSTAVLRLADGNGSNVKGLGQGIAELRIHWGPGLRIYFGQDGPMLVILLCGSTKRRQQTAIETARVRWNDYVRRKRNAAQCR